MRWAKPNRDEGSCSKQGFNPLLSVFFFFFFFFFFSSSSSSSILILDRRVLETIDVATGTFFRYRAPWNVQPVLSGQQYRTSEALFILLMVRLGNAGRGSEDEGRWNTWAAGAPMHQIGTRISHVGTPPLPYLSPASPSVRSALTLYVYFLFPFPLSLLFSSSTLHRELYIQSLLIDIFLSLFFFSLLIFPSR